MHNNTEGNNLRKSFKRTEQYDIDEQVKALKQLQQYSAFMVRKPVTQKNGSRTKSLIAGIRRAGINIYAAVKNWKRVVRISSRSKPVPKQPSTKQNEIKTK